MSRAAEVTPRPSSGSAAGPGDASRIVARATAVDAVGLEGRAAALAMRSIKRESKLWAPRPRDPVHGPHHPRGHRHARQGRRALRQGRATRPDRTRRPVAWPRSASTRSSCRSRSSALRGHRRRGRQSVAGGFPSGSAPLDVKLAGDPRRGRGWAPTRSTSCIEPRRLPRRPLREAFDEIVAVKEACGRDAPQGDPRDGRARHPTTACGRPRCSRWRPAPTSSRPPPARSACRDPAVDAVHARGRSATSTTRPGAMVGMKLAGGIRHGEAGDPVPGDACTRRSAPDWMTPDRFRIGASSLLNDVLMQLEKERTGRYPARTTSRSTDGAT